MLKIHSILLFLVVTSGSVYGQSGTDNSISINAQVSKQQSSSKFVATSATKVGKSKINDKQVSRQLQDYIQQLIRDKPEIVGCMEG